MSPMLFDNLTIKQEHKKTIKISLAKPADLLSHYVNAVATDYGIEQKEQRDFRHGRGIGQIVSRVIPDVAST